MKKLLLTLALIGCCFSTSFSQEKNFFSLEVNANTRSFFSSLDKYSYEVAILPGFNMGRFKFNIGVAYNYYETNQYKINYTNIPINVNFNIYKYDKMWFNCFVGGVIGIANKDVENYLQNQTKQLSDNTKADFSFRLGLEFSLVPIKNLKVNIAPFANYQFNNEFLLASTAPQNASKTIILPRKISLGVSIGVEYMFKFKE
ncbi:MAG: hypothetical protein LBM25_04060 [Bacteroidales bacterium]|jgi:hypothetical protein|nr:hypothetical protein [Bacteroidales bacterium]